MFNYISWESISDFMFDMGVVVSLCLILLIVAFVVNKRDRSARRMDGTVTAQARSTGGPQDPEPGPLPPVPPTGPQPGPVPAPHPPHPSPEPPELPLPGRSRA